MQYAALQITLYGTNAFPIGWGYDGATHAASASQFNSAVGVAAAQAADAAAASSAAPVVSTSINAGVHVTPNATTLNWFLPLWGSHRTSSSDFRRQYSQILPRRSSGSVLKRVNTDGSARRIIRHQRQHELRTPTTTSTLTALDRGTPDDYVVELGNPDAPSKHKRRILEQYRSTPWALTGNHDTSYHTRDAYKQLQWEVTRLVTRLLT